ncbi:hypothetical protein V9T40_000874 [Parthenolecanium corni]|uniref:Uncharacterized protein n=1 Tax=Parthenolecanium corni TaxID=536013 RepID=A0AAN9TAK4_9HEMI
MSDEPVTQRPNFAGGFEKERKVVSAHDELEEEIHTEEMANERDRQRSIQNHKMKRCCSISNKLAAAMSAPKVVSPSAKPDNIGSRRNRADGKKK